MEAFSLNSCIPLASNNVVNVSNYCKHGHCSFMKYNKNMIYCKSGNDTAKKNSGISSVLAKKSPALTSSDHESALVGNGNLVSSPNGKDPSEMHDIEGIGIVKFLRKKTFLVTGATGFLGKVLIEKMLRTAPDVQKIFVLIKAKDKEAAVTRLKDEIIYAELFKPLEQIHGNSYQAFMLNKLVPVVGNVCEPNLGLDEDAAGFIAKEVDIIINSAANTTFDERYDTALRVNTVGPACVMNFAKGCQKLKLFVQVSTAYVNGQRQGNIMEKPFSLGQSIQEEITLNRKQQSSLPKLCIEDEIKLSLESKQTLQENSVLQKMKELGMQRANTFGWQDTYVFTKAMGEMTIDSLRGNIPVVVLRPSVIESTYKEPFPGWMEGNRMMDPIIMQYGKGHMTGFLVEPNGVLDVVGSQLYQVPADMVANATLAAIAKHGADGKPGSNIYQIASSVANPLFYWNLTDMFYEHFKSWPFIDSMGRPFLVQPFEFFSTMEDFSTHLWKHVVNRTQQRTLTNDDAKLSRKLKKITRKSVEQAMYLAKIYEAYTFYKGRFDNSNVKTLMGCMSKEETQEFGFDVESIDWKDYIVNVHIPGLRKHVMKGRGL